MTNEKMRENSGKKIEQINALMKGLQVRVEARERIDAKTGFIEKVVLFIDDEKYEAVPVEAAGGTGGTGEAGGGGQ